MVTWLRGSSLLVLFLSASAAWAELNIPNGPNFKVYATATDGKRLYAGGIGGILYKENGVWHGMGKAPMGQLQDTWIAPGKIFAIKPVADGVIVGGLFSTIGNVPNTTNIAKWNGKEWLALGSGVDFEVHAIELFNGKTVVGGTYLDGLKNPARKHGKKSGKREDHHLLEFDGTEWKPLPYSDGAEIYSLSAHDGKLYAGGYIASDPLLGGGAVFASWDGKEWDGIVPESKHTNAVTSITWVGDTLYIGGYFDGIPGNANCSGLCRRRNGKWEAIHSPMRDVIRPYNGQALCIAGDTIYAVGHYYDESIAIRVGAFYYTPNEGWNPIRELTASYTQGIMPSCSYYENSLYVGMGKAWGDKGQFNFARFDGKNTYSGGGGFGDLVNAATVWNGKLVVGGKFQKVLDSPELSYLIQWDGKEWKGIGDEFKKTYVTRQVFSLDASAPELLIGGRDFNLTGGKLGMFGFDGTSLKPYGAGQKYYIETAVRSGSEIYVSDWYVVSRMPADESKALETVGRADFRPGKILVKGKDDIYAGSLYPGKTTSGGTDMLFHWDGKEWKGLGVTGYPESKHRQNRYNYWPDGGCLTEWKGSVVFGSWFPEIPGVPGTKTLVAWDGNKLASIGGGLSDGWQVDFCTVMDDHLYIGLRTSPWNGYELWKYDSTKWEKVADLAISDAVGISNMVKWNDRYYIFGNFNLFRGEVATGVASFVH